MDKNKFIPFGGSEFQVADIETARIVVLPFCYAQAPSYGTGSAEGPYHILNASQQLESLDEESLIDWGQLQIHTAEPIFPSAEPEKAILEMKAAAEKVLGPKKFLLSLGGDHAISIGPIMAASSLYSDIGILQIDAHLDMREEWNGSRYNHACVMRRITEDVNVSIVQVGIRSFSPAEANYIQTKGFKPFFAHEIDRSDDSWVQKVVDSLPERVYLTLDLDGLDPAVVPGTGTPEPGGLSYRQLVNLIKTVGRHRRVVAADITELARIKGSHVSEFTAAKIATKIFVNCLEILY
ncbi:agmatinase [Thermodesulfobacteriota bacterium]